MRAIAAGQYFVHDANRCQRAQLRVLIFRIQRKVVLDFLNVIGEASHLGRLGVITQSNIGFKRRFVAENFVIVSFVGPDGGFDGCVQLHPGHVGIVVIVGEKRFGAQGQKCLQRRIIGQLGRVVQQLRSHRKFASVRHAVAHRRQLFIRPAMDHRKESARQILLRLRQLGGPGFELIFGHVLGIKVRSRQFFRRNIFQERCLAVQVGPRAFVQIKIMQTRFACGRPVIHQLLSQSRIATPALRQEQPVDHPRCFHQFQQRLLIANRQRRRIHLQLRRREAGNHLIQLSKVRNGSHGKCKRK